jgi:phage major head subunit gpT-like protein
MAITLSANWAELLEPGLREIFYQGHDGIAGDDLIPLLFNVVPGTKAQEHFLGVGALGEWEESEGGEIHYDDWEQGFKTTLTPAQYTKGINISKTLVEDEMYNVFSQPIREMGYTAALTRQKHAASVFNNAFSSSYVGGDSVALCSASHPYSPSNATTHGNAGSTALSYDEVVRTRRLMREFVDDRGELRPSIGTLLVVPLELEGTANEICETMRGTNTQQPDTGSYVANLVQARGINYVAWDYLTDANNWFLVDLVRSRQRLHWIDRVLPEFALDPTNEYSLRTRARGRTRFAYGWSDWRFVYGHNVT